MLTQQEYVDLVHTVNNYRQQIHLFNSEDISEAALDNLKHQITLFEAANPDSISLNSPNYVVAGGILEGFVKVTHTRRMLSLNDIFNLDELVNWDQRWQDYGIKNGIKFNTEQKYICEPKIDGLAISIHYEYGKIVRAVTRGDGFVGEDVTENVKQINSIPKQIPDARKMEIRGEIFITKSDFEELNREILEGKKVGKMGKIGQGGMFANTRNIASGTIRQLDSRIVASRRLSFIAYSLWIEGGEDKI